MSLNTRDPLTCTPDSRSGADLRAGYRQDAAFDLFEPEGDLDSLDPLVRPAILSHDRRLIWGFRYLDLWAQAPEVQYPVLLAAEHATSGDLLLLALAAEDRRDRFRLSEIHRVLTFAGPELADAELRERILARLTSGPDPEPLVQRYAALPAALAEAVDAGTIDLRTAEAIPPEYGDAAALFLSAAGQLSFSNRRRALRMYVELLRRGGSPEELITALNADDPVDALRRLRYPGLTALEERMSALQQRRVRGTGVRLEPPPAFEGDRFSISFSFRNREELRARTAAAMALEEEMDELLGLLF